MTDIIKKLGFLAGGSRFRRVYEKMLSGGDKVYKDAGFDFKSSWFPVYYVLAYSNKPQTIMEITNQIAFTHITVKNILKELDKVNLIKIIPNPNDKRSKQISLSPKGKKLLKKLEPLWSSFSVTLKDLLTSGHPDINNILHRIESELEKSPIDERILIQKKNPVQILDYKPSLKKYFYKLAGPWLLSVLDGVLEDDDKFTLNNPDIAYLQQGGFLFFAEYKKKIVGVVALKRLNENTFEFAKLFVNPEYRGLGIATKLVERCITRCKENEATQLWLQSTLGMKPAHSLYYKMGFVDKRSPKQMDVLKRTEKIMVMDL